MIPPPNDQKPETKDHGPAPCTARESETHPGWIKGPDGWIYSYPNGQPAAPVDPTQTYVWITEQDDFTCHVCAPRHGTLYREGWHFFPPAHPNCRCTIALIPKPI